MAFHFQFPPRKVHARKTELSHSPEWIIRHYYSASRTGPHSGKFLCANEDFATYPFVFRPPFINVRPQETVSVCWKKSAFIPLFLLSNKALLENT